METNPGLGDLLASALEAGQWPVDLVWDITRALPETSTRASWYCCHRLPVSGCVVHSWYRGTQQGPPRPQSLARAIGAGRGGAGGDRAGRHLLPAAGQCTAGYVLPNLATSLNNQANLLRDLGQPEEALAVNGEALSLYRQLAAASPDEFTFNVAASLNNLALPLRDLGQPEEALDVIEEAVGMARQLAAARPDEFTLPRGIAGQPGRPPGRSRTARRRSLRPRRPAACTSSRRRQARRFQPPPRQDAGALAAT